MSGANRLKNPAALLFAAAALTSAVILVVLGSKLSFFLDDWTYILYRREFDLDAFFEPANEHLVAGAVVFWKLILAGFGMDSAVPFRVVSTAMFLLGVSFLFVWIRRRLGEWPALLATVPVLFMGAAFEDLLWFASITFLGSMACGLGMLLALDRRDALGDRLACLWLIATGLFSSVWIPFAAGAALDILLRRGERDWRRRAYVVLVPAVLWALWWLGWGNEAESTVSLHNIAATPLFVLDSFAAAIAAVLGLATPAEGMTAPGGLDWGRPLAVVLGGLALWRAYRMERIPRSFWVVLAIGLSFWVLGGFAVKEGRVPWASRYQYPGAVFVLLAAAELLRGVRLDRRLLAPAVAVVLAATASGGLFLHEAFKSYERTSQIIKADLSALEIARETVEPDFYLDEEFADTGFVYIDAGSYFDSVEEFGSPAYTEAELLASPEHARFPADKVLLNAERIFLESVDPRALPSGPAATPRADEEGVAPLPAGVCLALPGDRASPRLALPPDGAVFAPASATPITDVRMRRFSGGDPFPIDFGEAVQPGEARTLRTPRDLSTVPWKLALSGGPARVCGLN